MAKRNVLFALFDFSDTNYMKMPWRMFTEVLPIIAENIKDLRIYVLTDTKNVEFVKRYIERKNLKVLATSKPILRYPYNGITTVLHKVSTRLRIGTLVAFAGWNIGLWIKLAKSLNIKNLVLVNFLPIYSSREIARTSLDYIRALLKFGTIRDLIYYLKLLYENTMIRLSVIITKNELGDLDLKYVVVSRSSERFFMDKRFKVYRLRIALRIDKIQYVNDNVAYDYKPMIAYFGPLILPRGYDIVVEIAKSNIANVTLYSRDVLNKKILEKISSNDVKVVEKFFKSFDELINEARKHNLVLLPFRFVVSDVPLVVLELVCGGNIVVTTPYSHVDAKNIPNLIVLDLKQLKDSNTLKKLFRLRYTFKIKPTFRIDWHKTAKELAQIILS